MSDRESLDEKIERLEAEQEDLKDTVSKMLPNRRQVLKSGATAAGAGLLGFGAGSATAANDTSAGNVGAVNSPVDVYLDEIKDHGGNVVADIDDSGPINWQGRGFDNLGSVSVDSADVTNQLSAGSVSTPEAQTSNETFIRFTRGNISNSTSAGTFINPYDTVAKDTRNETNTSEQFSPDKDGEYHIEFSAGIADATAGDTGKFEIQNVTDSVVVFADELQITGNNNAIGSSCVLNLNSTKDCEIFVTNFDSSFRITTNSAKSRATVRWSVVQ